mgnify:CR=1 FL=1
MTLYLDYNASAPIISDVVAIMNESIGIIGNPSSIHSSGRAARKAIEDSREIISETIDSNPKNIIFVDPKMFDTSKSVQIAKEIEKMNALINDDEKYLLIGPGRWGSSDPWLGIPVEWDQISKAKIIIEYGMDSFPVDPSFGSHFFQNVTSMRLGYFTLNHKKKEDYLNLDWILSQKKKKSKKNMKNILKKKPKKILNGYYIHDGKITYLYEKVRQD